MQPTSKVLRICEVGPLPFYSRWRCEEANRASTCRYFDPETVGLDFEGMIADIESAPEGSVILLHGESRCWKGVDAVIWFLPTKR